MNSAQQHANDVAMQSPYDFPAENIQNSSQYIGDSCGAVREEEVSALRRLYLAQQAQVSELQQLYQAQQEQLRELTARVEELERTTLRALIGDSAYKGSVFH